MEYDDTENISSINHAWFLLKPQRMEKKEFKYKINEGDIIKIGRITIRITEIKNDKNKEDYCLSQRNGNNLSNNSIKIINSNNNSRIISEIVEITNKKKIPMINNNRHLESLRTGVTQPVSTTKQSSKLIMKAGKISLENKNDINIINEKSEIQSNDEIEENINNESQSQNESHSIQRKQSKNKICRICYMEEDEPDINPLLDPCICAGSMKYIHYKCLRHWINNKCYSKIENNNNNNCCIYKIKPIECELCKTKFPDLIIKNETTYNISEFKPEYDNYMIFEILTLDRNKNKYIYIVSLNSHENKIYIGRDKESDILFSDISVSRIHSIFNIENNNIFINDNDSTFGTLILIQTGSIKLMENLPLYVQIGRTFFKILPKKEEKSFFCCGATERPNDKFYFKQNERQIFYRKKITELNLDENKNNNYNENMENKGDIKKTDENLNIKKIRIKGDKSTNKKEIEKENESNKGDESLKENEDKNNNIQKYLMNYNENFEKINALKDISVHNKSLRKIKLNDELIAESNRKNNSIDINNKNGFIINKDDKFKKENLIDDDINNTSKNNSKNNSKSLYIEEEN